MAEVVGDGSVRGVVLEENDLVTDTEGRVFARANGRREEIRAELVVRAVGYRGTACPGVPYDEQRGVIPNDNGRIHGVERQYLA
ncbi:hypothetical protein AB5J62_25005 [Amycolatopsis sp. cg5]|uniref:hypothetical protein n=1 Tax=Amycolatopsis sp. cg5 TaxID=3238802 RepID=UPI0035234570